MPPISLRSLIAQATRGGGRSLVSRRNFSSSSISNDGTFLFVFFIPPDFYNIRKRDGIFGLFDFLFFVEPKLPRISIGWVVFGATSAAAGYGTGMERERFFSLNFFLSMSRINQPC